MLIIVWLWKTMLNILVVHSSVMVYYYGFFGTECYHMLAYVAALHITPVFNFLSTIGTLYMPVGEVHCNT